MARILSFFFWAWLLQLLGLPMELGHPLLQSHHLQAISRLHFERLLSGETGFCDVAVQLTLHLNQCAVWPYSPTLSSKNSGCLLIISSVFALPVIGGWLIVLYCILSANHPYLQHEGWIAKGAAQTASAEWILKGASGCRQTVINDPGAQQPSQMLLTWVKARPHHRKHRALLFKNSVWVL